MYQHPKHRIRSLDPLSPDRVNEVLQPAAARGHRLDGHSFRQSSLRANADIADGAFYGTRSHASSYMWGIGSATLYNLPDVLYGDRVTDSSVWEVIPGMSFDVSTRLGFLWINMWVQYIWHVFSGWGADDHVAYHYEGGYADDGFGSGIQFAIRIDGRIYPGTPTGHSSATQRGYAAIKARPEIISTTILYGPQQMRAHKTVGVGPQCFPVRIFSVVPVTPGSHTIELVVRRPMTRSDHQSGWSSDDYVHVYGRQAFIMRVSTWPAASSTPASVEVPAMSSEDVLSQTALATDRVNVLVNAYNNIPTGAVTRGAFDYKHMPRALLDWAQVSIQSGAIGVATDNYFPGYMASTTVVEGTANLTGQTGWCLIEDSVGNPLDTLANHPGTFNATEPCIFLVLANIQVPSIELGGNHDIPALFGMYAIAADGDIDGTGLGGWHVNSASQALVNNYNTFGLPHRNGHVDPEEMDVALMAIYNFKVNQLTSNIIRFGVVASQAYGGGLPGTRATNRWRHGSLQVFRFRPGDV